jgi:hypothetical protein
MANLRQDWQPRPSPSAVASTTASSRSLPLGSSTTSDQRSDYLSTHGYELDASSMGQDQWATLAAALGMAPVDDPATNPDIAKVAHKIRKRRTLTDKHRSELLTTIVASIAHNHPRLSLATQASFNRDAVPLDVPQFGIDSQWKIRLPTPKPAIAVGYNPSVFSSHQRELQQGIISDPTGEPRDLSRISQTTPGLYWPFFIIEIDGDSMIAARNASAGATATCNNALLMLAGAVVDPQNPEHDEEFINSLSRAIHSFSLAVSGKTACLMTHNSEGCLAEAVGIIRSSPGERRRGTRAAHEKHILMGAESALADYNGSPRAFRSPRGVSGEFDGTRDSLQTAHRSGRAGYCGAQEEEKRIQGSSGREYAVLV